MHLGKAIKSLRKRLEVTQTELAEQCSISQSALSSIESGKKIPGAVTLANICAVLNITESMLYVLAIQEKDVHSSKKDIYKVVYPMIEILTSKIADSEREAKVG